MGKTILVCGYGPGISAAVAEKFGGEGFSVALVARNAERLDAAVKSLAAKRIEAAAFPADLGDPGAAAGVVARARASLGPIAVIHWNAYGAGAGDLLNADAAAIRASLDVATTSLVLTVQAALPDLRKSDAPAVLVTNGGFGLVDAQMDAVGVQYDSMGISVANAAKNKLVGLLAKKLEPDGVYVGQVMVLGTVKGTAWDQGNATLDPRAIGEKFWSIYRERKEVRAQIA